MSLSVFNMLEIFINSHCDYFLDNIILEALEINYVKFNNSRKDVCHFESI